MKTFITIFITAIFMAVSTPSNSQTVLQGNSGPALEKESLEVAQAWGRQLAMSPKQVQLMQRVLIEHALKKNEAIQSDLSKQEKDRVLVELHESQISDIRDVLTKLQFERYIAISNDATRKIDDK